MRLKAHNTNRRGFAMLDMIGGLLIASTLLAVLIAGVRDYRHGALQVARARQAAATAERVLVDLQLGRAAPKDTDDTQIAIVPVPGGERFATKRWVAVRVTHLGRSVEVIGVVPASAVQGGAE